MTLTGENPLYSHSDLFEKSDDILAHVGQTDNDVVVVDVTESGVVSALPSGLLQDQVPAVDGGQEVLVLSEEEINKKKFLKICENVYFVSFLNSSGCSYVKAALIV